MEIIEFYSVTATAPEDGHRLSYGEYLDIDNAESARDDFPQDMNAQIIRRDGIRLDDGRVVEVPRDAVKFKDDRQRILDKLTPQERVILGV